MVRTRGSRAAAVLVGVLIALIGAASASARTYDLTAGPVSQPASQQLDFDVFFAKSVTVHRGDTVRWAIHGFHDVVFPAKGQKVPPAFLPNPADPALGQLDPAGLPFWFNGQPNIEVTPQAQLPAGGKTYDGSTFTGSGLPAGGPGSAKPYSLKFVKTGTFTYYCLIHAGMVGTIKVVAPKKKIKSPGQVRAAAKAQQKALTVRALQLAKVAPTAGHVRIGNDAQGAAWLHFFPASLTVKAGQSVSFDMHSPNERHTVTFGPASYTTGLEKNLILVKPNPVGPPTLYINPIGGYPSDPGTLPPYTGANHKIGFENSGLLVNQGPQPSSVVFKFTKAGTYHYECVLHPGMDGVITVTP